MSYIFNISTHFYAKSPQFCLFVVTIVIVFQVVQLKHVNISQKTYTPAVFFKLQMLMITRKTASLQNPAV